MKYIIDFFSFPLLEETFVKFSPKLLNNIMGFFQNQLASKYPILNNTLIVSLTENDILYDTLPITLGAVILQKKSEISQSFDDDFISQVKKSIEDRKLTPPLVDYLSQATLRLEIELQYIPPQGEYTKSGAFILFRRYIDSCIKKSIFRCLLRLNLLENNMTSWEIEHELTHLTQAVNGYSLLIGQKFIKNPSLLDLKGNELRDLFEQCYDNLHRSNFGGPKTKTNLRQGDIISMTDPLTNKPTKISRYLQDDGIDISTPPGLEKARRLQYILDDDEYKPWIATIINEFIDTNYSKIVDLIKNSPQTNPQELTKKSIMHILKKNDQDVLVMTKYRPETIKDLSRGFMKKYNDMFFKVLGEKG